MLDFAIALLAVGTLVIMSLRASERFDGEGRLPMQWSLDGKVNGTAPRFFALAFTPALSALVLGAIAALAVFGTPEHRQGDVGTLAIFLVGLAVVGGHALHLFLIGRTLRKRDL